MICTNKFVNFITVADNANIIINYQIQLVQCFVRVEQSMLGTIGTEIGGMNSPLVKSVLDKIKRSGNRSSL